MSDSQSVKTEEGIGQSEDIAADVKPPKGTMCRESIQSGWHSYDCPNKASVVRNGKPYCGIHDPDKVAARRAFIRARDAWKSRKSTLITQRDECFRKITKTAIAMTEGGATVEDIAFAVDAWKAACIALEQHAETEPATKQADSSTSNSAPASTKADPQNAATQALEDSTTTEGKEV